MLQIWQLSDFAERRTGGMRYDERRDALRSNAQ
jgi:hypothetical protein